MRRAKSVVKLFGTVLLLGAITMSGASCSVFDELEPPPRTWQVNENSPGEDVGAPDASADLFDATNGSQDDAFDEVGAPQQDAEDAPELDTSADAATQPSAGGLKIVPDGAQLQVGSSIKFEALSLADEAPQIDSASVLWTSGDEAVATVDADGLVEALAVGTTEIQARAGAAAGRVTVVVVAPIERIEIDPQEATIEVTQTVDLVARVIDIAGDEHTDLQVHWVSTDTEVASVDALGRVQGLGEGTARVVASVAGAQAETLITVQAPVRAVSVTPNPASVGVGSTGQMQVELKDLAGNVLQGRVVEWTSSAPLLATVDDDGTVHGLRGGEATITASSEGVSASAQLVVADPVASIEIQPASLTLDIMQISQLTAVARDAADNVLDGRLVTWRSDAPAIAMVDVDGRVTGINPGQTEITASAEGHSASILVTVQNSVTSLSVNPGRVTLEVTESQQLTATARNVRGDVVPGAQVRWISSDSEKVKVDSTGRITAMKGGSATITAKVGAVQDQVEVTVQNPVRSVSFSLYNPRLEITDTMRLRVTLKDKGGNSVNGVVEWQSEDASIASVSSDGTVLGVKAGSTYIKAKSNGVTAQALVEVIAPPRSIVLSPSPLTLQSGRSTTVVATPKDKAGNSLSGYSIAWSVSHPEILLLGDSSVAGLRVTGGAAGTTTLRASIESARDGEVLATMPVTVTPAPVAQLVVTPSAPSVPIGESVGLTAVAKDSQGNILSGRSVTWRVADPSIAMLELNRNDSTVNVNGVQRGNTIVTASCEGVTADVAVQVTPKLIGELELE